MVYWSYYKVNIGDKIKYLDECGESAMGTIQRVLSDMDSYEEMKFKDGISYYASKKLTAAENSRRKKAMKSPLSSPIFVPVKPKNMASVFLEIAPSNNPKGIPDYIPIAESKNV
jgi:hypothetical protein